MQAVDGDRRSDSLELGLTEDESKDWDKEVYTQNPQYFFRVQGGRCYQLPEDQGRVVLNPAGIEGIL